MKIVLVTGATNGIGLEASVALARGGDTVVMVGRDEQKTSLAAAEVKRRSGSEQVEGMLCDFSSQASIRALARQFRARHARLDVLINNAGTVFPRRTVTQDGIEATFAVNHLGYFLVTRLLEEVLVASAPARVVNVASVGHYQGKLDLDDLGFERGRYQIMRAYWRSKLANVLFTRSLARRLKARGVTVNALHPGAVATNIFSHAPSWVRPVLGLAKVFMLTPEQGGQTLVYLATSREVEGSTGLYFEKNRPRTPAKLALDEELAERLWAESARLVQLPA